MEHDVRTLVRIDTELVVGVTRETDCRTDCAAEERTAGGTRIDPGTEGEALAGGAAGLRQLDIIVRRNFEDALDHDTGSISRIEAGLDFVTVTDPVIVGIYIVRISAGKLLVFVRQTVAIRVFDIVIDAVTIGVFGERAGVGAILVEVGQAVAVVVELGETKAGLHRFLRLLKHQAGNLDIGVGISAGITKEQLGDSTGTYIAGRP